MPGELASPHGEAPLRVAFVLPTLAGGGAESVILRILGLIDRSVVEPVLVVGIAKGELSGRIPPDVEVVELGRSRTRSAVPRLRRALSAAQPDVVLATLGLGNAALIAKPLFRSSPKTIVRLGSTLTSDGSDGKSVIRARLLQQALKLLYRRADLIIAQSDAMLEDAASYLGLPGSSLIRIYNPVDVDHVLDSLEALHRNGRKVTSDKNIVSVGRLHHVKGYDVLLDAFAGVREVCPDSTLTIVGEGPERARIWEQARSLGIADHVRLPGWVADPLPILLEADVYVLSSRYEGMNNALLEALVGGIPVVVSDCPSGNREVVREGINGYFCKVNDSRDMMEKIVHILTEARTIPAQYQVRIIRELLDAFTIVKEYESAVLSLGADF